MTSLSLHVTAPSNMKFSLYFWSFDYNSRLKGRYQWVRRLIFYLLPALVYERSFREMAFHSSSPPPENEKSLPTEMKALVVTIFVTITIVSIFGNTMVIRAFYKFSNLQNAANVIVVSLSVAGISMSVPFILHIATILVGKKVPPHQLCAPASIINLTLIGIVILHLTLISVERFIAVKFAMTYHTIVTNRRTVIASTVAWLWGVCAVNAFPEAFKATDEVFGGYLAGLTPCQFSRSRIENSVKTYLFFLVISTLLVPIMIIIASYSYIFKIARKQRRQINEEIHGKLTRRSHEMKGAYTVAIIVGTCLVSFIPLVVVLCLKFLSSTSIGKEHMYPVYLVASLNACWNPMIYCWRNENFRNSFKRLLKCKPDDWREIRPERKKKQRNISH